MAAEIYDGTDPINLGTDHEITIRQTVETIKAITGFTGDVVWDSSKPDGQPRRRIDPTRAHNTLGWRATMDFEQGLQNTLDWFLAHRDIAEADPS